MYDIEAEENPFPAWEKPSLLPPGLADMAPGPELAQILAGIDPGTVSGYARVNLIVAHQRMASHHQAESYREMALLFSDCIELFEGDMEAAAWALECEVGTALHLTGRGAQIELGLALSLERLSRVREALSTGKIDLRRAQTMIDGSCHLPDRDAQWVIERVIEEAEGLTTGQLRVKVQRLCYLASPEDVRLRYGEALNNRYVRSRETSSAPPLWKGETSPPGGPRPPIAASAVWSESSSAMGSKGPWTSFGPISCWTCCWEASSG